MRPRAPVMFERTVQVAIVPHAVFSTDSNSKVITSLPVASRNETT